MTVPSKPRMSDARLGAWLINITKHLVAFAQNQIELYELDNITFAGKCGNLLIKLAGDVEEELSQKRVEAHAKFCSIAPLHLAPYLAALQAAGCIDHNQRLTTYHVLPFSRERVLGVAAGIFRKSLANNVQLIIPNLLEYCLVRPRLESEVRNALGARLNAEETDKVLQLITSFGLVGVVAALGSAEAVYFNEYQFGDSIATVSRALGGLSTDRRAEITEIIERVAQRPGLLIEGDVAEGSSLEIAIALGFVEVSEVESPAGTSRFLTSPRLPAPAVGSVADPLAVDVFHHAKMLLSSLRFGQYSSVSNRGQIRDPSVLIRSLLERERVGPCTAIGQDYVLLETEGVIRAEHDPGRSGRQFYMELRRREPAELVLHMLEQGASGAAVSPSAQADLALPTAYAGPEYARSRSAKQMQKRSPQIISEILQELRT